MKTRFLLTFLMLAAFGFTSVQAQINWTDTLDRADWVVLDASNELNAKEGAIDGDLSTVWGTHWDVSKGQVTPLPHHITIDMGDFYEISEIIYLPRQDQWGLNGTIKKYTIAVGNVLGDMGSSNNNFKSQNTVSGEIAWTEDQLVSSETERIDTNVMTMERPLRGRYLRIIIDSCVTPNPEAIITEVWPRGMKLIDYEGMVSRENWKVVDVDTALNAEWKAIDGDFGSGWSTPWKPAENPPGHPHHLTIDMSEETDIDSLLYICRQDMWGNNGVVTKFEVYVSNDMEDWGDVEHTDTVQWYDEWELADAVDSSVVHKRPMVIAFDSTATGRYLKLVALAGSGNWVGNYPEPGVNRETHVNELYAYGAVTGANYIDVTDSIANFDFELGTAVAWSKGWGGGEFKDTSDAHGGSIAGLLARGNGGIGQVINVKENTKYQISAYVKVQGKAWVGAKGYGAEASGETTEADWTLVKAPLYTSIGATTANIYMWSNNDATGLAQVDDYMLEEIGPANYMAPVAMAEKDATIESTDTVMLDGSKSYDENGDKLTYKWTADAGVTIVDATVAKPMVIADATETDVTATISLVVNDGRHDSEAATVTISITGVVAEKPVANAGAAQTVKEDDVVTLDGSASTGPEGTTLTYKWTAPAGITLDDDTAEKPTFTAPAVDADTDYEISLVVNDGANDSPEATVTITVEDVVGLENSLLANTQIFPNPVVNEINIVTDQVITKVTLVDISGAVVAEYTNISNTIDVSNIANGMYVVSVETTVGTLNQKVIIKK